MSKFPVLPAVTVPKDFLPTIIVDKQEKHPLPFTELPVLVEKLDTGDYSYLGGQRDFCVERKSLEDLTSCVGSDRKRFEYQLQRLKAYDFARLLIVGTQEQLMGQDYYSMVKPDAVLASLHAFEVRYVTIVWCDTPEKAARQIEHWVKWHYREKVQSLSTAVKGY